MTERIVDINELDEVCYYLESCSNALDLMSDALQEEYEKSGVGFIAYSMKQLVERLEKLMEEAEAVEVVKEGEKNG